MKKHKICKILLVILAIFLCVAFYELLGICVAYKMQKRKLFFLLLHFNPMKVEN